MGFGLIHAHLLMKSHFSNLEHTPALTVPAQGTDFGSLSHDVPLQADSGSLHHETSLQEDVPSQPQNSVGFAQLRSAVVTDLHQPISVAAETDVDPGDTCAGNPSDDDI